MKRHGIQAMPLRPFLTLVALLRIRRPAGCGDLERQIMLPVAIVNDAIRISERSAVSFHRTPRVPDDGGTYPLPPGRGTFPLFCVEDYRDRPLPEMRTRGGGFIPADQREALWSGFHSARWKWPIHRLSRLLALAVILPMLAAGCRTEQASEGGAPSSGSAGTAPQAAAAMPPLPGGWSRQDQGVFRSHPTWAFVPPGAMPGGQRALLIVLHGCNQTFNQLKQFGNLEQAATKRSILLAIPDVGTKYYGSDAQRCWDYDMAQDKRQHMNGLVAIAEALAAENSGNKINRNHVYIVGLSSGGAMAMTVACKRPDLFAGVGSVAGPSVGSMQGLAINGPIKLPQFGSSLPLSGWNDNLNNMITTCRALADKTGTSGHFDTQIANIAVGDMEKDGPNAQYSFQSPVDQADCDHAGQIALVSQKWNPDNVEALRRIYGADELGGEEPVQGGRATKQAASKNGKERIALVTIKEVGHAWPAGRGDARCIPDNAPDRQSAGPWIAQRGLDYPEFITSWLMTNNVRGGDPFTSVAESGGKTVSRRSGR